MYSGLTVPPSLLALADEVMNNDPFLLHCMSPLLADFVAEVGDYYARGLPRFVDTSSYYAAFGER
jgi:hypothetical protein